MILTAPRLVIAGLSGDGGKTLVAVGLARALRRRGVNVAPYKKGPDYIDAAWLGAAAGRPGRNLDTYLMTTAAIGAALGRAGDGLVLVEGNRGLHDGVDALGTHSTAALAARIAAPAVLVADTTKTTRTLAACVHGCAVVDPDLSLAGVILNRVATARQERVVREAFDALGGPPVLGAIPRLADDLLPSRHLGLVTAAEHPDREAAIARAADVVAAHVDLDALLAVARSARPAAFPDLEPGPAPADGVRIGVLRDEAFSFYYPENLEALAAAGAELVDVSPLRAPALPPLDALYIGGGFPEVHARRLAANAGFLDSLRRAAADGLPVYAECGGLMFLARSLRTGEGTFPMAGVIGADVEQTASVQGHGYAEGVVEAPNPFFPVGTRLLGHEFHYSRLLDAAGATTVVRLERGTGVRGRRDAIVAGNVWASYVHLHALGTPEWATGMVAAARRRRDRSAAPQAPATR